MQPISVVARSMSPTTARLVACLQLLSTAAACDVCDGIAAKKVASGEVLEISDEGLERLAPAHDLLALLLYRTFDARTQPMQSAFDSVAAALKAEGLLDRCVMAQLDTEKFPRAAALLHVEAVELPAIRMLRGDASFGYPLRAGFGSSAQELAARIRSEIDRGASPLTARLELAALQGFEHDGNDTRVVADVTRPRSVRAIEQVAHALHGAVRFAMPFAAPPSTAAAGTSSMAAALAPDSPTPPSMPPSAPPAPSAAPPSRPPVASARAAVVERVRLLREVSADTTNDTPLLEMPAAFPAVAGEPAASGEATSEATGEVGGLSARALYRWVRWAALPSVFALTQATAPTYLVEGASGVLFQPGVTTSNKTREYAVRRLRKLARRLQDEGAHGLWLLWADSHDPTHARLRVQLGMAEGLTPSRDAPGGAPEGEFAIVVMAGGRMLHRFIMPPPLGFEHIHTFALAFLNGELLATQRRLQNFKVLGSAAALLLLVVGGWPLWRVAWRWCCTGGGAPRPEPGSRSLAERHAERSTGATNNGGPRHACTPRQKED